MGKAKSRETGSREHSDGKKVQSKEVWVGR